MRVVSFNPERIIESILADLPERSRDVVRKRFGLHGGRRETLESIGDSYHITRERVRQIENLAKEQIKKSEHFISGAHDALDELKNIVEEMGGIVEEETLLDAVSPSEKEKNHLYLLLELGEYFGYAKEDDDTYKNWYTNVRNADMVKKSLKKLYKELDTDEILTKEEILARFMQLIEEDLEDGVADTELAKMWLAMSKRVGKNPMGRWGRTDSSNIKTRGVRDYAYLVLREHGEPMHFRDIAQETSKYFNKKINTATMHNELIRDDRFALVGRGLYALNDWGLYGGTVKELIIEILKENKAPMTEDAIIKKVLDRKLVKESTIRINLKDKKHFYQDKETKLYSLAK
ncbi:MAG: HTH domain-containing protein [Patescibacteria group bacterium]